MERIKDIFLSITSVSKEVIDMFFNLWERIEFKKKHIFTSIGETSKYFYIIESGYARSYYEDENGKQFIRTIFPPYRTTGSLGSLISGKPSKLTYDCLTDCVMYKFNFEEFKDLSKNSLQILKLYSEVLEFIFVEIENRIFDLSLLSAKERYLKLKEEIPDIENIIPQYHIASYLNVTPVQLSRIRKELYSS